MGQPDPISSSTDLVGIARSVTAAGGRAVVVGGFVRDQILGLAPEDVDVEVYGLDLDRLAAVLAEAGEVTAVGRSFGVLRVKGLDVDFALPRRDTKVAAGHRGFQVTLDPGLSFAEAARRRDLTINSMGLDPLTGEILDPYRGRDDLATGILRATAPRYFAEDPLRGLRVAQLAARFEMRADPELERLCAALDLSELPSERVFGEMRKLLVKGRRPSVGLGLLRTTGLLRFLPELAGMVGVDQDPEWHPEGDVWTHTLLVVDEAAALRSGVEEDDLVLVLAALCHDLGKQTTTAAQGGRVRSLGHEAEGGRITRTFLERLRVPSGLTARVCALVEHHLAPAALVREGASDAAFRRLARKLAQAGASMRELERLARADHRGRSVPESRGREYAAGNAFLARVERLSVAEIAPGDVVLGRHLLARGLAPGPHLGPILRRCRKVQDETGWSDPARILNAVLGPG